MSSTKFIYLLNVMGILSCKKTKGSVKFSIHVFIFNFLKLATFIIFKENFSFLLNSFVDSSVVKFDISTFSKRILSSNSYILYYSSVFIIFYQLVFSKQNIEFINQIMTFQKTFKMLDFTFEKRQKKFKRKLARNVLFLWIFTLFFFILNFLFFMQISFESLFFYVVCNMPYFVNASFICYVYSVLMFLVFSQKCSKLYAAQSNENFKVKTENVKTLRFLLFEVKENFVKIIRTPLLVIMFHYICESIVRVSFTTFGNCRQIETKLFSVIFSDNHVAVNKNWKRIELEN